jgi:ADP-heptose:LPS heptosyltransferase
MMELEEFKNKDYFGLGNKTNWYSISSYLSGLNFDESFLYIYKQDTSVKFSNLPKEFITISAPSVMDRGFNRLSTKLWSHNNWNKLFEMFPNETFVSLSSIENLSLKGNNLINLGNQTNVYETADIISRSRFLISIEGGLVHIAKAVKKKSIVLFGPTSKWFFGYPDNINIKADYDCFPCHNQSIFWGTKCVKLEPNETYSKCMEAITVEKVANEVEKLLKG